MQQVAVLYLCLSNRAINDSNGTSFFIHVKEKMTVVLTIFKDDSKAPLTIIEK